MLDLLFFCDGRLGRGRYFTGSMALWPLAIMLAFVGYAAIWASAFRDSDTAKFLVLGGVGVLFFRVGFATALGRFARSAALSGTLGPVALVGWINLVLVPGTDMGRTSMAICPRPEASFRAERN